MRIFLGVCTGMSASIVCNIVSLSLVVHKQVQWARKQVIGQKLWLAIVAHKEAACKYPASQFLHFMPENTIQNEVESTQSTLYRISWKWLAHQHPQFTLKLIQSFLQDSGDSVTLRSRWQKVSSNCTSFSLCTNEALEKNGPGDCVF